MKLLQILLLFILLTGSAKAQKISEILVTDRLDNASSFSVSSLGIYVVESLNHRLLKLDIDGNQLNAIGGKGIGDYRFDTPVDVTTTNGLKVYISDQNNNRIVIYDRRGQFLSTIEASDEFGRRNRFRPSAITVNKFGEVFFADLNTNRIRHYDLDGNVLPGFDIPEEVQNINEMISSEGKLYLVDQPAGLIHILSESGMYRNFIPANELSAFDIIDANEAMANGDQLEIRGPDKGDQQFDLDITDRIIDIQWLENSVYLLTATSIYRIELR